MQLRSSVALPVAMASAAAPVQPLTWELPFAVGTAEKRNKKSSLNIDNYYFEITQNMQYHSQFFKKHSFLN